MSARRRAALAMRAALTFSCAVLVHGAVHAAGSGSFVLDSPAHGIMVACALALLAGACVPAGLFAPAAERRRRLALLRSALAPGRSSTFAAIITQVALAVALLGAEGASLSPHRILAAAVCGVVALVITTLALRASGRRIADFLAAFFAACDRTCAAVALRTTDAGVVRVLVAFRMFPANRPPPVVA